MSEQFLLKLFEKFKPDDFKNDPYLMGFYEYATKAQPSEQQPTHNFLLSMYVTYILENKKINNEEKDEQTRILYDDVKKSIIEESSNNDTQTKFKLSKKVALNVLSEYIKCSLEYEDKKQAVIDNAELKTMAQVEELEENFKERSTDILREECKDIVPQHVNVQQDARFSRRNILLDIYRDTEARCNKMVKDPRMQAIFKTFYYLDSTQSTSALWHTIPVYDNDTKPNLILPSVQVPLIMLNPQHNTKVSVLQSHPMTEAHNRIKNKAKVVLICSGSSMVPGGCSDQGIETNETALYLASSYSLFINQLTDAYPLELNNLVVIPHVLVFKNPCSQDFAPLDITECYKVAVITAATPFKPSLTGTDDDMPIEARIYHPSTRYKNAAVIIAQTRNILKTALYFGYDTVIFDDKGIDDYYLPAYETAILLNTAINEYRGKFREIVIAINKPDLYKIYKNTIV